MVLLPFFALLFAIDVVVLISLVKLVFDEDMEIITAFVMSIINTIATLLLGMVIGSLLEIVIGLNSISGVLLSVGCVAICVAFGLGVSLSLMFGVEIKRALLVGLPFTVANISAGFTLKYVLNA